MLYSSSCLFLLRLFKKHVILIIYLMFLLFFLYYPHSAIARLGSMFLSGSLIYVYKDHISLTWTGMFIALLGVVLSLCCGKYAEIGIAIFGAYLVISFALLNNKGIMTAINNKYDFSYGIYIYGSPIERTIIYYYPHMGYLEVFIINLLVALLFAMVSWYFIEKPALNYAHKLAKRFQVRGKGKIIIF